MDAKEMTDRMLKSSGDGPKGAAHRGASGFTLIELLVVVSIIALLVSILLPALSQARDQTKRLICKTQMHQVGIAILMYASDNNDKFSAGNFFNYPIANYGDSDGSGTPHEDTDDGFIGTDVQSYLSAADISIFICPANKTVLQMPAFFAGESPNMSTLDWYQAGNFNYDGPPPSGNHSYYIYYYYFGNYPRKSEERYLPYVEFMQKKDGFMYPSSAIGPRAKIMQDLAMDENEIISHGYDESHEHPNGLFSDGSVEALLRSELKPHFRTMTPTLSFNHYW